MKVTQRQAQVLDAYCRLGQYKLVAREFDLMPKTVANILSRARRSLGCANHVTLAVTWDRYQRGINA